jgi:hypothetical protein
MPAERAPDPLQHVDPDRRLRPLDGLDAADPDLGLLGEARSPPVAGRAAGHGHRIAESLPVMFGVVRRSQVGHSSRMPQSSAERQSIFAQVA